MGARGNSGVILVSSLEGFIQKLPKLKMVQRQLMNLFVL